MTDYLTKLHKLDQQLNNKTVHRQANEIEQIINVVAHKGVLPQAPAKLGFLPDQFEEILNIIGQEKRNKLTAMNHLLNSLRQFLSLKFGIWSLPNLQTAFLIKNKLGINSALEIMAGNAYWSYALKQAGVETIATDSLEWAKTSSTGRKTFYSVKDYGATEAIKKFRTVDLILCSWSPNFGQADLAVAAAWRKYQPQSKLLFVGEKDGATNSAAFWEQERFIKTEAMKEINASFSSYDFIDEKIFELKR